MDINRRVMQFDMVLRAVPSSTGHGFVGASTPFPFGGAFAPGEAARLTFRRHAAGTVPKGEHIEQEIFIAEHVPNNLLVYREQQIGGSGGSLEPPGPLLEPPGPLLTHLHTVYMVYSECLPTRLNPLAERTCFFPGWTSFLTPSPR